MADNPPAAVHTEEITYQTIAEESLWVNLSKQAKFILLGGIPVWYLDVPGSFVYVLKHGGEDWTRTLALIALAFLVATMVLFAYVILLPARGVTPNYARWNKDPHLHGLIPALTVSIVGGFITLLLLLSPLCTPKITLNTVLPQAIEERLMASAESAGSGIQGLSQNAKTLAAQAASSLFSSLHRPAVPVRGGATSWLANSSSGKLDSKKLLEALKMPDVATLAHKLNVPAKRISEFSRSLERGLLTLNSQSLQASLAQLQQSALAPSNERNSPNWWLKKGVWGWCRALGGAGATYLLVFGTMGLLGLFGMSQGAARRRQAAKAKESL